MIWRLLARLWRTDRAFRWGEVDDLLRGEK
jgi:hypothetical protein